MPDAEKRDIIRQHLRNHPNAFGVVRPGPQPGEVVFVRKAYRHIPRDELPRRIPWSVWRESICPALAPSGARAKGVLRVGDAVASGIKRLTGRQPCGGCGQREDWLNRLPFRVHGVRIPGS